MASSRSPPINSEPVGLARPPGLSSTDPVIVELADLVDAALDDVSAGFHRATLEVSHRIDSEVGVIVMKMNELGKKVSRLTDTVEDLQVKLENLDQKVENILKHFCSFRAQGFSPLTRWGVAGPQGRQACGQTNRPVA